MQYHAADFERAERRVREDIWSCAPEDAVLEAGVQSRWFGPVLATSFAELPDVPGLNTIQGAAEPGAVSEGHLSEAVDWMRGWEVDFMVPVATERPEADMAESWLNWHDCEQSVVMRKYVRGVLGANWPDAPGVEVHLLPAREEEGFSLVAAGGMGLPHLAEILFFGMPCLPNWRCYVAYLDGNEVACGSMLIEGKLAILGPDATLPEARSRGCNRALLRRRLNDAAAAGCQMALSMARDDPAQRPSADALRLLNAGFTEAYRSVVWQRLAPITVW